MRRVGCKATSAVFFNYWILRRLKIPPTSEIFFFSFGARRRNVGGLLALHSAGVQAGE